MKKGISLMILIVTVIILGVLTSAVLLTAVNKDGVIDGTNSVIESDNKKAIIQKINTALQLRRIQNANKGIYDLTMEADIIPILQMYGTYEKESLKLTTKEDGIIIYLYEIIDIPIKEFIDIEYEDNILALEEKEIKLTDVDFKYEYTTDNGVTWNEYSEPVTIESEDGISVRIKNDKDEIVSRTHIVSTGDKVVIDTISPTIIVDTKGITQGKTIETVITVSDDLGLAMDNVYEYYLSTSVTDTVNGEWKPYTSGTSFFIGENLNGTYYMHLKPIRDVGGNEYSFVTDAFVFDNTAPTINFSVNGNSTYSKSQSTMIQITDVNSVMYSYGWSDNNQTPPTSWLLGTNKSQLATKDTGTGNYYLWVKDLKDSFGNEAATTTVGGITTVNAISNAFAIDNTAPNSFSPSISSVTVNSVTVSANTTDSSNETIKYYYSINNGTTWLPTNGTTATTYTFTGLTEATTYSQIKVKAVDSSGNEVTTGSISAITESTVWTGEFDIGWYVKNTGASTYSISTAKELAGLALLTANVGNTVYYNAGYYANTTSGTYSTTGLNFSGKTINIMADINLNNNAWTPGGTFAGTLNGNGHTISGLSVSLSSAAGFMLTNTGTIKKVIISGATVTSTSGNAAGLVVSNSGTVDSCAVIGSNIKGYGYSHTGAGGIVCANGGLVINSYNTSRVELSYKCTNYFCGQSWIGGICGSNGLTVNCYNAGTVVGGCRAGGFVGTQGWETSTPRILNCYNMGSVTGTTSGVGFGLGWIQGGNIQYCYGLSSYSTKVVGGTETTATIVNNNNTTFSGSGTTWTLSGSVAPNGTSTTNLLTALNAWITANGGAYNGVALSTWKVDSSKNGGKPILSWQ